MTRSNYKVSDGQSYIKKDVDKPSRIRKRVEKEKYRKIEEGDRVNLSDLLFTKTRDYLIKYNDNQRVKAEQLAGKVIVLYLVSLADISVHWREVTEELVDIYNVMQPKGGFEVVFVAVRDAIASCGREISIGSTPQECFEKRFSVMPWTAIPFSDLKSRERLGSIFGIASGVDHFPGSYVFDPTGVFQCNAVPLLEKYGTAAYPFTKERIEFLESEDAEAIMQLSKKALLASPERDFLITNKGDQVPINSLEDKVVGLLFFDEVGDFLYLVEALRKAYEQLAKNKENFEIVLIYVTGTLASENPNDEESFWDVFRTMPWLALPFKDANCKKLMRIFDYPMVLYDELDPIPSFVIVGPHGKFVEPYADNILFNYGIPAYPFTRSSVVNLVAENAKTTKLERFWEPDSIFTRKNGSQVRFSQLTGKRIIVLFEYSFGEFEEFVSKLRIKYIQMKNTDDEFEVIHICNRYLDNCLVATTIPWLMHPPFNKGSNADKLLASIFTCDGLLAFDVDGTVVRRTECPNVQDNTVFPFYDGDFEGEIFQILKGRYSWKSRNDPTYL